MEGAGRDALLAAGTEVGLAGGVGLYGGDDYRGKIAHTTTATVAANASTTMRMSTVLLRCGRNGLKPKV